MKNKNEILNFLKEKSFDVIKISGIGFFVAFFGSYAGSEGTSKNWRRLVIPSLFILTAFFVYGPNPLILILGLQFLVFRLGHGVPGFVPGHEDEGSFLGRVFYKLCNKNNFWTNFCVRGFKGLFLALSFAWVPFIKGNFLEFIIYGLGIFLAFALLQWRDFGQYIIKIFGKTVYICVSDIYAYGALGILGMKILI